MPKENDVPGRLNVDGLDGADDVLCCCPNALLAVWLNPNPGVGATLGDAACENENGTVDAGAGVSVAPCPNPKPELEGWPKFPEPNAIPGFSLSSGFENGLALAVPNPNPGPVAVAGLCAKRVLPAGVLLVPVKEEKSSIGRSGAFPLIFMSRLGLSSMLISWSAFGGVAGRTGAGAGADCPKLNGLLVSAALLPALACPKLNGLAEVVGGAGEGVPKANSFFSAGAGEADANEKGGSTEAGFSSAGAVLGRGPNGKPAVEVVSCFPKNGLGVSITGAGTGAGVEDAGPPNEKALFDGSVIAGVGACSPKENPGLDGSATGAETAGVPKPKETAGEVAPKSDGGLLASCSAGFGTSLAGAISAGAVEAPNKNGEEDGAGVEAYGCGGEMTGEATCVNSIAAGAAFGGARTPNDVPVLVEEGPKIEVLADGGAAPNIEVVAGAGDGVADI